MKIHDQDSREWHLFWSGTAGIASPQQVQGVINEMNRNPAAKMAIRRLLGERLDPAALDESKLAELLGSLINRGQLVLFWQHRRSNAPKVHMKAEEQVAPARSPLGAIAKAIEEAAGFPPLHDMAAQVGALMNAAVSGTPFCEECEKARQAAHG